MSRTRCPYLTRAARRSYASSPLPSVSSRIPASYLRENRILPWRIADDHLVVAFYNPLHMLDIYDDVIALAGMPISPALLSREQLLEAMESCLDTED